MAAVIVGFARTPFAKYMGAFATIPATTLGAHAIRAALERAGVGGDQVDRVLMGQVLQGGAGQGPARQAAVGGGVPLTVPAATINAVCLSGTEAVVQGAMLIETGRARVVVAGGMESMTLAPHAWPGSRLGHRYGAVEFIDTMDHDGLWDAFEHVAMGASTEQHNADHGVTREDQDAWAAESHRRLEAGAEFLEAEIAPYTIHGRKGDTVLSADDGLRKGTTVDSLSSLAPAFGTGGGITAGNASQITDGAAAVVLADEDTARELGLTAIARVVGSAMVAGPDVSLHSQPSNAIRRALADAGRSAEDLAAVEINEAFAAVAVVSTRQLGVDPAIVNAYGGAIALGHPIGASGARIVGHLARRLAAAGSGSFGAAGICGGGGQGSAVLLEAI